MRTQNRSTVGVSSEPPWHKPIQTVVTTHASYGSLGLTQQPTSLVVAHGFDVHIGRRRQPADRKRVRTHGLTPYLGTEASML